MYTNGFKTEDVITALKSRLGWKQPTLEGSPVLNSTNLESKSGRYFNDGSFHPLVTVKNYKDTLEDPNIEDDSLNIDLEKLQESVIMQAVTSVFAEPELIDNTELFDRSTNNDEEIDNSGKFVGIRFKLAPGTVALQIKSIAITLNGNKEVPLYLYHESKVTPIWTDNINAVANDQTIHIPVTDLILNDSGQYKSGYFYLGYYQEELGDTKAISENYCEKKTYAFGFEFFEAEMEGDDFDRKTASVTGINYGLNAEVSTFHDHTQKIIRNAALFDNLQGLQLAANIVGQQIFTTRSNATERALKDNMKESLAYMDLQGTIPAPDSPKIAGLQTRIEKEKERLRKTFFPKRKAISVNLEEC